MPSWPVRKRYIGGLVALLGCAGMLVHGAPPASASPSDATPGATKGARTVDDRDAEGGTRTMREQLEKAAKGYLDAELTLENSHRRQARLTDRLSDLEAELVQRTATLGDLAATAYRNGRLSAVSALLGAETPDAFLDRADVLRSVAADEDKHVRAVVRARNGVARATAAVTVEIAQQKKQLAIMGIRKAQAERALVEFQERAVKAEQAAEAQRAARAARASAGFRGSRRVLAQPAPRTASGALSNQSCTINDPTTAGCITPRTLHALKQSKAAGFRRFVSCFRGAGPGEHPLGRACDYAVHAGPGFGGVATGKDRAYGDELAAYLVRNARRLGVLYVIWYKQIWFPGGGWQHYSRGRGDPSSDHTNHIHLSMY